MMLETTATPAVRPSRAAPHYGSPDKDPAVRLRVLEDAGRVDVPFTTGILIGIGETLAERAESLFAIRQVAREYGAHPGSHRAELPGQAGHRDARACPTPSSHDLAATVAVARLVLGPEVRIQAPPNLIGDEYGLLLRAGIDDWGGVSPLTPDHVNPERPWPQIDELAARTAAAGFTLRERLTIYPEYVRAGEPWLDPRLPPHVAALADPATGLAARGRDRRRACRGRSRTAAAAAGRPDRPARRRSTPTGRTADRRERLRQRLRRLGRRSRDAGRAHGAGPRRARRATSRPALRPRRARPGAR